jgi:hypothetical protein
MYSICFIEYSIQENINQFSLMNKFQYQISTNSQNTEKQYQICKLNNYE